jgi:N-acetylmuramic acid 6-phosphate etherase
MNDRSHLLTEQRLPESMNLDAMSIEEAVAVMNEQDRIAVEAVARERANVVRAIELVVQAFKDGGRLIYAGAGTSGRLGVLDASECPPTFGISPNIVRAVIAGGRIAMFRAVEGAEDSAKGGAADIAAIEVGQKDVVMGIAAGGTTPYVYGALKRARALGAKTIFLCCVQRRKNEPRADVVIRPLTGPEVLTGSTRLKAGTATKLVLNQISTISMVRLGKCYQNLMVDLRPTNKKLQLRARSIVAALTQLSAAESNRLLKRANGDIRVAVLMACNGISKKAADDLLRLNSRNLRAALETQENPPSCSKTSLR